jgi:hypothetical protein
MAGEIKNLHTSAAMAGAGGMAAMTPQDYGRVGARLRFEYERLAQFARDLKDRQFTAGALMARVDMYVNAASASHEAARRDGAVRNGFDEERNLLGASERHCSAKDRKNATRPGCVEETARGWVAIGMLSPVGHRLCISNCACSLDFRKSPRMARVISRP